MEDNHNNNNNEIYLLYPDMELKLRELLASKGVTTCTFDVSPATKKGDNYLGVVAKVTVKGTDEAENEIRFDWIVKSAPQEPLLRDLFKIVHIYEREVSMYEKVFPAFRRFEVNRGVVDSISTTPIFLASHLQPFQESFAMEDMKALGYVMRDRRRPLDLKHVRLVMKAYGKLHAVSYAIKDQSPQEFEKLRLVTEEMLFKHADREEMGRNLMVHGEKVIDTLDPIEDVGAIQAYKVFAEKAADVVVDTMILAGNDSLAVVGHGDSWINNMLFKYDDVEDADHPTRVCLLDWQLARYGSPAFDLSYFFFTCTDKQLRDKHYDKMIKVYYYAMCAQLVELGSDPEVLVPFEALLAQLRRYSIYGLYMSTMVLQVMMSEVDEIPDWNKSQNQEEVFDSIDFVSRNQAACNERIRGIVVDFYEKGYLDFLK